MYVAVNLFANGLLQKYEGYTRLFIPLSKSSFLLYCDCFIHITDTLALFFFCFSSCLIKKIGLFI